MCDLRVLVAVPPASARRAVFVWLTPCSVSACVPCSNRPIQRIRRLSRGSALGLYCAGFSLAGCALYGPGLLGSGADLGEGGRAPVGAEKLDAAAGCTVVVIAAGGAREPLGGSSAMAGGDAGASSEDHGGSIASGGTLGSAAGGTSVAGSASNSALAGSSAVGSGVAGSGVAGSGVAGSAATAPLLELARGKPARSSNHQFGNDASRGNDGDFATRWCASNGSYPQFWRVDLGAQHSLQDFSVRFEHASATYGYTIETSNDDAVYLLRATVSGTGAVQTVMFPEGVSGRYVKITVTSGSSTADGHLSWASFSELTVDGY